MEPQDIWGEIDAAGDTHRAPRSLLPDVLERLGRLDPYLSGALSESEVRRALRDASWDVRAAVLGNLAVRADWAVDTRLDLCRVGLGDEHPAVRAAAGRALASLEGYAPAALLLRSLRDQDAEVHEAQAETLITKQGAAALAVGAESAPDDARVLAAGRGVGMRVGNWHGVSQRVGAAGKTLHHLWLVLSRQPIILRRNWLIVGLVLAFSDAFMLALVTPSARSLGTATTMLGILTTLCAALSVVFAANVERDAGVDVLLSTSTSVRTMIFSRFLLIVGGTSAISGAASAVLALSYSQGFWTIVQQWFGPLLLVSSLVLALGVLLNAGIAFFVACVIEGVQTFRLGGHGDLQLQPHPLIWQTSPLVLVLALACLLLVYFGAPGRLRALGPRESQ